MTFLHTALLGAGLAAVALPIIIHLLMRRRRKPVRWGAMRFVMEAYRRTRRRLVVEKWLLLAVRCLAVAALAVVIGRPIVGAIAGASPSSRGRTIYLLIDNSIAAGATDAARQTALARHTARAKAIIAALPDGDRVGIVLLGAPAQPLLIPSSPNLAAAAGLLDTVLTTDARADIPGGLGAVAAAIADARQRDARADAPDRTHAIILSDLTTGSADSNAALPKLPTGVRLLAVSPAGGAEPANIALTALVPQESVLSSASAGRSTLVSARLERSGGGLAAAGSSTVSVRLVEVAATTGPPRTAAPITASAPVRWSPGQREATATLALALPASWTAGGAALIARIDDDALLADNTARVPIELRETLRIGLLGSSGQRSGRAASPEAMRSEEWAALALRPHEDSGLELADLQPGNLDAASLAGLDTIFVADPARLGDADWSRLAQWAQGDAGGSGPGGGGLLIISPSADQTVHTWPDAMTRALGLPWAVAREARSIPRDDRAGGRLLAAPPGGTAGATTTLDLLAPLRGELADLARPVSVDRVLPLVSAGGTGTAALWLADGTPWLWFAPLSPSASAATGTPAGVPGRPEAARESDRTVPHHGAVVYFASALELAWTDLPVKPLMVPLLHELVRQGVGRARPAAAVVAGFRATLPGQSVRLRAIEVEPGDTPTDIAELASITLDASGQTASALRHAGLLEALDTRGTRRGILAVNADHTGSRLDSGDPGVLVGWLSSSLGTGKLAWLNDDDTRPSTFAGADVVALETLLATRAEGRASGPEWMLAVLALLLVELWLARRMGPTPETSVPRAQTAGAARA
ncbi:MAG: BatA domain-containing protein [Phycisphaerales bacterium]